MDAHTNDDDIDERVVSRDGALSRTPQEGEAAMPDAHSQAGMTREQAASLYISHALSTWNARTYEFAAVSRRPTSDMGSLV
jgi:hypothetical protein